MTVANRHPHRLEHRDGRRVFAKLATDRDETEELRREAGVYALLARRFGAYARLAPACLGWSQADGALYLEAVDGEDLAVRTAEAGVMDAAVAAAFGEALAALHAVGRDAADEWPGDARSAPVGLHRPTSTEMHEYSAGALQVVVALQRSAPLCAHLDRLCVRPEPDTLIHGDARLENVIVGESSGLYLVDWEFAGAGEALWDPAFFVASCLGAWISSIPSVPGVPPECLLAEAELPINVIRPALAAFWSSYRRRSSVDCGPALRRCVELAAVRLVQLGVEAAARAEELRAVSVVHLQVAHNMLERPDAAAADLLGVVPRHG
jgi:aminoglycoside phosphotransferase (APT) family kinase protein